MSLLKGRAYIPVMATLIIAMSLGKETLARPKSYREAIDCSGALKARARLPGLTDDQITDYSHDAQQYGPAIWAVTPKSKLNTLVRDSERAAELWLASVRKDRPAGLQRLKQRAQECWEKAF